MSEQRDDFAGVQIYADPVDRMHAAECLADVAQLDERLCGFSTHAQFSPNRRRYSTSNTTATINTCPMITIRLPIATSSSSIPLSSDCMISAPSAEPRIDPAPPASARPPITAAAITQSSIPVPSELVPALTRAIETMAAT